MSRWGYTGGYQRPKSNHISGDPEGPAFEEIERQRRLQLLRENKRNYDRRFGGPVFSPRKVPKQWIWDRYPAACCVGLTTACLLGLYAPIYYHNNYVAIVSPQYFEDEDIVVWGLHQRLQAEYPKTWWLFGILVPGYNRYCELKKDKAFQEQMLRRD